MAKGINKVILIGNLGKDPDVRYMPSGGAVTNAPLATSETWKDKQTGERREKTEWHRLVFFNRLAEVAGEYLRKGSQIYVEGRIQTRKWQGQDGQDRYTTEIIVNDMNMLGGGRGGGSDQHSPGQGTPARDYEAATGGGAPGGSPADGPGRPAGPGAAPPAEDFDDDIPF